MAYEVQSLTPRHKLMIELRLQGMDLTEIARTLGVTSVNVGAVLNSPLGQRELELRGKKLEQAATDTHRSTLTTAKMIVEERSVDAINVLTDMMLNAQNESTKFRAAKAIMDEALRPKDQQTAVTVTIFQGPKLEHLMTQFERYKHRRAVKNAQPEFVDAEAVSTELSALPSPSLQS